MKPPLHEVYTILLDHYGPQHWWPGESDFEMMLGAVLTQNTAWTNVEKALDALKANTALTPEKLAAVPLEQLAEWIRPAGYFNQKAGYIKAMVETLRDRFNNSITELFQLETKPLRKELLSWKGVGPETADSILLYAARRPAFVVDAYTKRVAFRHGWIKEKAAYDAVAGLFTDHLPSDVRLFNEYHALIVRLCKEYCNTKPKCKGCPLQPLLPNGRDKCPG